MAANLEHPNEIVESDVPEDFISTFSIVDDLKTETQNKPDDPDIKSKIPLDDGESDEPQMKPKINLQEPKVEAVELKPNLQEVKDDSLIISTEEDLEMSVVEEATAFKQEEKPVVLAPEELTADDTMKSIEKPKQYVLWVYNINEYATASVLKRLFSQHGEVATVKILTDGQALFGYVVVKSAETANKCMEYLNHILVAGKEITVSNVKPICQRKKSDENKAKPKPISKKPDNFNTKLKNNYDPLTKKCDQAPSKPIKRKSDTDWRKEYMIPNNYAQNLNRRLLETERRLASANSKLRSCDRDNKHLQVQLREERRKFNREIEQLEKKNSLEQVRLEADRAVLNKELEEVRRLREHLKQKIEEVKVKKTRKSGSPSNRKRKWHNDVRVRSPPPPPKLSQDPVRKRGMFEDEKKIRRVSSPNVGGVEHRQSYNFEHQHRRDHNTNVNGGEVSGECARGTPWGMPYVIDTWRPLQQQQPQHFGGGTGERFNPGGGYQYNGGRGDHLSHPPQQQHHHNYCQSQHYDAGRKY